MTLTEKILANAAGKERVEPGESVLVNVDVLMTHDVCGPGTIGVMKREFGEKSRVWDSQKVVIIPDHYIFTGDERSNRNVDILREFVREQGIKYFYDVIDDERGQWKFDISKGDYAAQHGNRYAGVCHVALAEKGHTRPGEVLVGTDSHTCTAGAFGEFATGIGNTDAAFVMGTGKMLLRVPETLRFNLTGKLQKGVMAKDIILHIIGEIGFDGATYMAMEFGGDGIAGLSMEERMTVANMGVEAGAKNAVFEVDDLVRQYVDDKGKANGTTHEYQVMQADAGAVYAKKFAIDLSTLEPTVALHPNPGQRAKVSECAEMKLDRAYIGSCTGGKMADFEAFAEIVTGRKVAIATYGVPATVEVREKLKAKTNGGMSMWDALVAAGVKMTENAGCAACLGGPSDTFGRVNQPLSCISTTNRNFPGRMGHADAKIHLASPYTVAASAVSGCVTDPRKYL